MLILNVTAQLQAVEADSPQVIVPGLLPPTPSHGARGSDYGLADNGVRLCGGNANDA